MKRKIYLLAALFIALVMSVAALSSCSGLTEKRSGTNSESVEPAGEEQKRADVEKTDTKVIIKVNKTDGFTYLIDVMNYLKAENELAFEMSDTGMLLSMENKACDTVNWAPFWYLYTSDAEMANTDWGTVRYNGEIYGSAILGAGSLDVIAGGVYVWYYQTNNQKAEIVEATETMAVIKVNSADGFTYLIDVMDYLKGEKDLDYEISSTGMILSINGKTPETNAYWMLYTSDAEMANADWGVIDYSGNSYGSAILGANALEVSDGALYIWTIVSFS